MKKIRRQKVKEELKNTGVMNRTDDVEEEEEEEHAVAQLVEPLHYKPEGRGFDSRWCHCGRGFENL